MYAYYACTIRGIPVGALKWLMTVSKHSFFLQILQFFFHFSHRFLFSFFKFFNWYLELVSHFGIHLIK